jgi:hypothetical protein
MERAWDDGREKSKIREAIMKRGLFWAVVLGLALSTSATAKDHGDKGKGHGNRHNEDHDDRDDDHGRHGDRWEARNGWEYRTYERDQRPPGWSKGRKTGWGNCNLPPGQAKKYGCNTYRYQEHDYYWYRDEHERIIIRRPIISIRGGVDIG